MKYIGIDPGLTGAIAVLYKDQTEAKVGVIVHDMPTFTISGTVTRRKPQQQHTVLDVPKLLSILRLYGNGDDVHAYIEKVMAMPRKNVNKLTGNVELVKMGAAGMLNYGINYGIILGVLAALNIPYTQVMPVSWKRYTMAGMPKEKEASLVRAKELYPQAETLLTLKKHHGRADAILIATYGAAGRA